jgi:hypothetical protein
MISDSHRHILSRQKIADVDEAAAAGATTTGKGGHLDFAESSGLWYLGRGGARDAGARVFDHL